MSTNGTSSDSPAIRDLLRSLPSRFRPDRAVDWRARFHFILRGAEQPDWTVRIEDGRCDVEEGLVGDPQCVVRMKARTFIDIERGALNAQAAFMKGRIKVSNLAWMVRFLKCVSLRRTTPVTAATGNPAAESGDRSRRDLPLSGIVVLDLSRMLPGAVLARQLIDLGARLIKVEDAAAGDPMRHLPPLVEGTGAGFATLLRGAESVCLDLSEAADAQRLRRLARRADVLVESFRPGTMARWDLGARRLRAVNQRLIWCSLSAYGSGETTAPLVGHDLNLTAITGLLSLLDGPGVPRLQVADVGAALLASTAILAALLVRERTGAGTRIDQPLLSGPLPFVTWAWADDAATGDSVLDSVLAGRCPCYRTYRCTDGLAVAVGAIEPKLWSALVKLLGLPELTGAGLADGEEGERVAEQVAAALASRPREHWLRMATEHRLPVSPVNDIAAARTEPLLAETGLLESTPLPGGSRTTTPGPFLPSLGRTPARPAPELGEHTEAILRELGIE